MHDLPNPYGYATNEYWEFEAKRHGFQTAQAWLQAEERQQQQARRTQEDYNVMGTFEDGY